MPTIPELSPNRSFTPVFRVHEHEVLRLGDLTADGQSFSEIHLQSLLQLAERTQGRYFNIGHRAVRFRQYVGILATPQLQIEILPKLDRRAPAQWQNVLIDMLRDGWLVQPEVVGKVQVHTRPGALLHWYLSIFLEGLKGLLRTGLLHTYTPVQEQLGVLKGRLQLSRQVQHNYIRRERFWVTHDEYNNRHPVNILLGAALAQLQALPLDAGLRSQFAYLQAFFPKPQQGTDLSKALAFSWSTDHRLDRYRQALQIARHILEEERPDIRSGQDLGLALVFDMNQLFEAYLYRQLLRWRPPGVHVERQQSRSFWGGNRLRPDLLVSSAQGRWVLDAKWRQPSAGQPSAEELRQIYVYCDYFAADRGVLIYPQSNTHERPQWQAFAALPGAPQHRSCLLCFAQVLNAQGQLNAELGRELFAALTS